METFTLENLLASAGKRMRLDLSERLIAHPGELGANREEVVRDFLRAYLPKRFEVSTGFAFDSTGRVSKQLDIIIANALVCPRFETAGGIRYYPCESIVAVGQVRSSMTSIDSLMSALENLESAKELDRSGSGKAVDILYAEEMDNTRNYLHQMFSFVFITGDSLEDGTMHRELVNYVLSHAAHVWPNVILALDKYLLTFCCDNGICPNPMDARGIAIQPIREDEDLLMRFYLLLGQVIEVTRVGSLPYWEYLQQSKEWTTMVFHSTMDDPPPYLSSITSG